MLAASFQNRVARVIATLRLVLAIVFLAALLFDPEQPNRHPETGYALLGAYVVTSAILLRVAWVSWWYDFRFSTWAYALDVAVFSLSVWFTEGPDSNFNSPFIAFYFFLMLSSALRWNWRVTMVSAMATGSAYLLIGTFLISTGQEIDLQSFLRRLTYMAVIAVAYVLLGIQSRSIRPEAPPAQFGALPALEAAVRYVAGALGARTVALVWEASEEPGMACILRDGVCTIGRFPALRPDPSQHAQIFDREKGRCLSLDGERNWIFACTEGFSEPLSELADIRTGLFTTLQAREGSRGELLVGDLPNMAIDDLGRMTELARHVVQSIEERTLVHLERTRAVVQTREALSRDLHDSVAQALAGATFNVEVLRQTIPAEASEARELANELKLALRNEQSHIRAMIDHLRFEPAHGDEANLHEDLREAVEECRQRWAVEVDLVIDGPVFAPSLFGFECRQIVREAVSNAVRHGQATRVGIRAGLRAGNAVLDIVNNGSPFADTSVTVQPRTIRERVLRLEGTMQLLHEAEGPRLVIELPLGKLS